MTAPSLPETLRALHRHLPERIREADLTEQWGLIMLEAFVQGDGDQLGWHGVYSIGELGDHSFPESLVYLETALRQECQARGWMWRTWAGLPGHGFGAEVERRVFAQPFQGLSDTPAHALALALLGALGGEGT
ncbi:hypothetical protein DEIGR_400077 [Deinococcus grandis]|uniref:Uncharacterized protein n=1 Tax=Deinococcus grandis TaxID=57498 RepID=A0A100HQR5_9DEIO|nr:hypothetical protein [Deinococcus grandis]GAQ23944.1 hypothetical protein DEIGR_400077 [Deinococcus grandis]